MGVLQKCLDILFPPRCIGCGAVAGGGPLCAGCAPLVRGIEGAVCPRCGQEICACDREGDALFFERLIGAYYYDEVRRGVAAFKFEGRAGLAIPFAQAMTRQIRRQYAGIPFDAVVPVPMHPLRERERGYNQAELLAKQIARSLRVPMLRHALTHEWTDAQHRAQSRKERIRRVDEAIRPGRISGVRGKRVLLVDDIATTSATLNACARLMIRAGAADVFCVTIALTRKEQNEE